MIVVDANILIYSLIKCDQSPLIQRLRAKDSDWRTAALCLHETLNVLATYQRREVLTLAQCRALLGHADRFIKVARCEVEMELALAMAAEYAITGYDAQYVALARSLNAPLITEDRKLRKAVPGIAFSMQEFLGR
jgi:predicted nucleic acid-binding protein